MKGDDRYKMLKTLPARQVALILIHRHRVRRINVGGTKTKNYALGMSVSEGADEGIYDFDEDKICALASEYNAIDDYRNWKAVLEALKVLAPVVAPCADADSVAVGNGIYDYGNKFLIPLDPELVFTMKSHVDSSIMRRTSLSRCPTARSGTSRAGCKAFLTTLMLRLSSDACLAQSYALTCHGIIPSGCCPRSATMARARCAD